MTTLLTGRILNSGIQSVINNSRPLGVPGAIGFFVSGSPDWLDIAVFDELIKEAGMQ